jgi:hypothetical protein
VIHSPARPNDDAEENDEALTMGLLAAHIPLTLLLDLAETFGPPSHEILEDEGHLPEPRMTHPEENNPDPLPLRTSPQRPSVDAPIEA